MLWNAKNGSVRLGGTEMDYVSFGKGAKSFIVLPGLSDGLMTVKGKALLLAKPYVKFFKDYTVYMFSGAEDKTVGIAASYEMEGKIKHSELYIYQGLGHGAYDEAKDFYSRVYNFLIK